MPKYNDVEKVRLVFELAELGYTPPQVGKIAGVSAFSVRRWLKDNVFGNPYLDQVAIERALKGDRAVYERLTFYELIEFAKRARASLWYADYTQADLAERLGQDPDTMNNMIGRHHGQQPVVDQTKSLVAELTSTLPAKKRPAGRPPKLDEEECEEVYRLKLKGWSNAELGKKFDVSKDVITRVYALEKRKHV